MLRHTMMHMVCTGHGRAASAKGAPSGRCERPCAGLAAIAPERFRRGVSQVAADAGGPRIAFRLGQSDLWRLLACTMSQAVVKRGGRRGQASISLCCSTMAWGGLRRCMQLTKWTINEAPWQAVVMNAAAGRTPLFDHDWWWTGREPWPLKRCLQEFIGNSQAGPAPSAPRRNAWT